MNLDNIIKESIDSYLMENLLIEKKSTEKKKTLKDKKKENEKAKENSSEEKEEKKSDKKKKKKFRKNAIKGKGGLRKDFDTEDDENYNQNVDDQEQSSIRDLLNTDYVNVSAVAQDLYPDHTPQGAQSELRKKLKGEKSDSGSTYKLKSKEVKKLRAIIAANLK